MSCQSKALVLGLGLTCTTILIHRCAIAAAPIAVKQNHLDVVARDSAVISSAADMVRATHHKHAHEAPVAVSHVEHADSGEHQLDVRGKANLLDLLGPSRGEGFSGFGAGAAQSLPNTELRLNSLSTSSSTDQLGQLIVPPVPAREKQRVEFDQSAADSIVPDRLELGLSLRQPGLSKVVPGPSGEGVDHIRAQSAQAQPNGPPAAQGTASGSFIKRMTAKHLDLASQTFLEALRLQLNAYQGRWHWAKEVKKRPVSGPARAHALEKLALFSAKNEEALRNLGKASETPSPALLEWRKQKGGFPSRSNRRKGRNTEHGQEVGVSTASASKAGAKRSRRPKPQP